MRLIEPGSLEQFVEGTVDASYNLRTISIEMCYRICLMKENNTHLERALWGFLIFFEK